MDKPGVASSFPDHCFDNDGNLDLDGAANVYTAKTARYIQGNYKGLRICGRIPVSNTGASTLAVDDAPAIAIKGAGGADPAAGDLAAGTYYDFIYDDANNVWQFSALAAAAAFSPVAGPGIAISGSTISARLARRGIADITAGSSAGASDRASIIDIASGTGTLTFDAAATLGDGWFAYVRNNGTGDVTLSAGGGTIDGLSSWVLYPGGVVLVQCDGSVLRSILVTPMVKTYAVNDTWTRPGTGMIVEVEGWGGGGSGGRGASTVAGGGAGGGGYQTARFTLASVSAAVSVTIGAGGTAKTVTTAGDAGGNSSFGAYLTAFGGRGGAAGATGLGGGGGGQLGAGSTSTGGAPNLTATTGTSNTGGGGGNGGASGGAGGASLYGGGGGGGGDAATGGAGGASLYGGGGGGGGGDTTAGGALGASVYGGSGSAGTTDTAAAAAAAVPGGGGGGSELGNSGAGGAGRVTVRVS